MKKSSLLISFSVLAHLIVIDGIFYLLAAGPVVDPSIIISYNSIWLIIALVIGNHSYDSSRG